MQRRPHIALLLAVTLASGCIEDNVLDPDDRPNPPPAAAFDADFSFFEDRTPASGGGTTAWTQALQSVGAARSAMAVLEVPEALLRAAGSVQATRAGDVWQWPFTTTVAGVAYAGELRSHIVANQHEWSLSVSSLDHSPPLNDYLWAVGITSAAGFDGVWSLADAEAGTNSVAARISWVRNSEDGVNFGFAVSDTAAWTYERSSAGTVLTYVVYSAPEARVTWSTQTGMGTSWTPETSTSCWNADLHDVAC
jgi:hypothetical protein